MISTELAERRLLPDFLVRHGIRRLLSRRLQAEWRRSSPDPDARLLEWTARLAEGPLALSPEAANEQHYEVPADFFRLVLGPYLKYSCGYWREGVDDLAGAEEAMLDLTAQRAGIADGQRILDLGCGWGSFSLYAAERYPNCEILAVSNSEGQGRFIREHALRRGLKNLRHRVADVNELQLDERFDRVVSIEMFEHLRNHRQILARIAGWLTEGGRLFVHIFCHRELTYPFEDQGPDDWMARHFFTGGLMPAADLLPCFGDDMAVQNHWLVPGDHYRRTAEAWLERLDHRRAEVLSVLQSVYGSSEGGRWLSRWRIFFMACAELFGTSGGTEWFVSHYKFARRDDPTGIRKTRSSGP